MAARCWRHVLILFLPQLIKSPEAARANAARWIALVTTVIVFGLALWMTLAFDETKSGYQFVERADWYGMIQYHLGIDGISVLLILLTAFLMPLCILASWTSIEKRVVEYMAAFLLLQTLMIGVFCALDIVLFYIFFEAGADPDVSDHRDLGREEPRLCGLQILPLYAFGLALLADRDCVDGDHRQDDLDPRPASL